MAHHLFNQVLTHQVSEAADSQEATDTNFKGTTLLLKGDGSDGQGNTADLGNPSYKAFQDNSSAKNQTVIYGSPYGTDFSPYYYDNGYWSTEHGSNGGFFFPHSSDYNLGYGEFTIEFWMNADSLAGTQYICGQVQSNGAGSDTAVQVYISNSDGRLTLYMSHNAASIETPAASIQARRWHFISCVRQDNTLRIYVDGVQKQSGSYTGTVLDSSGGFGIGQTGEYVGSGFNGFVSNFRYVVGSCLRDDGTTFTVPSSPFTDPTTTGELSVYFDGNGDYLTIPDSSDLRLGTSNFTIEFWTYLNAKSGYTTFYDKGYTNSGGILLQSNNNSSDIRVFFGTGPDLTSSSEIPLHEWTHVALVRNSGTATLYFNGVSVGSVSSTDDLNNTGVAQIGRGSTSYYLNGYISNFRIVKGSAYYTSTFTPSTSPFTTTSQGASASEVKLLTCQSKIFTDESNSGHAITPNGDSYISGFDPYGEGYWSVAFDGTNDELKTSSTSSDFAFGTGDFTVECFIKNDTADVTQQAIVGNRNGGNDQCWCLHYFSTANRLQWHTGLTVLAWMDTTTAAGKWYHVAVARSGTTLKLFLNGVETGSYTDNKDYSVVNNLFIGYDIYAGDFNGQISNLRIVKGTALYTSGFTPPSGPLSTTSQSATSSEVKFLGLQSNRFIDNSASDHTMAVNAGTPKVSDVIPFEYLKRQTKILTSQSNRFVDNSPYVRSVTTSNTPKISTNTPFTIAKNDNVGSAYITQGSDDVEIKINDLPTGTSNRCIEFWVYFPSGQTFRGDTEYLVQYGTTSTAQIFSVAVVNNSGKPRLRFVGYGSGSNDFTTSTDLELESWNFISVTYDGTTIKHYLNGVHVNSYTFTLNTGSHTALWVNAEIGGGDTYVADNFFIADLAVYDIVNRTKDFFPPTTTVTSGSNTKVLTFQYSGAARNVGFLDDSKYNTLIGRIGDSSMGTFSPFSVEDGYWSTYFDGTNDNYTVPNSTNVNIGAFTEDYTLECFFYLEDLASSHRVLFGMSNGGGSQPKWLIGINQNSSAAYAANKVGVYSYGGTSGDGTYSPGFKSGTWYHFRLVYTHSNTTTKIYIDGTEVVSFTGSVVSSNGAFTVGTDGETDGDFFGYISNVRLVKGTALGSTVPTEPLTAITNTVLLSSQSNRFVDNSTNGYTLTPLGNTRILPYSPFAPSRSYSKDVVGGSVFLDGTGDRLEYDPLQFRTLGNGDFSIEVWWYPNNVYGSFPAVFSLGTNGSYSNIINIGINNSSTKDFGIAIVSGLANDFTTGSGSYQESSWNHLVMARKNGTMSFFNNGKRLNTVSNSETLGTGQAVAYLGSQWWDGARTLGGYYSSFRVVVGESAYDPSQTTLTVPTAPVTDTSNTVILSNFANAGIFDHSMKCNLETEGKSRVSTQQKKYGTGSIYLEAGDIVTIPYQPYHQPRKNPFTLEMFIYFNSTNSIQGFIGNYNAGWYWQIYANELEFAQGASAAIEGAWGGRTTGQWYHIAVSRDASNNLRQFVDGTQLGSTVSSNTTDFYTPSNNLQIGNIGPSLSRTFQGGYMDEIRLTLGVARYTEDFTPPSQTFPNK